MPPCIIESKVANPNKKEITEPPKIIIGNAELPSQFQRGTWIITLLICSENANTKKYILIINWNGIWHDREADMTNLKLELTTTK